MKKEKEVLQKKQADHKRLKKTYAILILVLLSIVEVYLMMNFPTEYLFLGVVGLVILCLVYWITDLSFKIEKERDNEEERERRYENLYKAVKISYVSMKQNFLDVNDVLDKIKENSEYPVEEVIQAQKGVAKLTIQRNKENAQSIMESNFRILERMDTLEETLREIMGLAKDSDPATKQAENRQQEIMSAFSKVESIIAEEFSSLTENLSSQLNTIHSASMNESGSSITSEETEKVLNAVKNGIDSIDKKISEAISVMSGQAGSAVQKEDEIVLGQLGEEPTGDNENADLTELLNMVDEMSDGMENQSVSELPEMKTDLLQTDIMGEIESQPMPEFPEMEAEPFQMDIMGETESQPMPELSEMEAEPFQMDIMGETESQPMPELSEMEAEPFQMDITGETESQLISEFPETEMSQPVFEEPVIPDDTGIKEQKIPEASSDPNHVMTPDEIAALLGDIDDTMKVSEPVVEEKPPMPDLSDPSHVMTPDEIAALLANL